MRVRIFELCDAAVERDGFLTVANGGLNAMWRADFPAPLLCDLAIALEVDQTTEEQHFNAELRVVAEDGSPLNVPPFGINGRIPAAADAEAGHLNCIIVTQAIQLRDMALPREGVYRIEVHSGGERRAYIRFEMVRRTDDPGADRQATE